MGAPHRLDGKMRICPRCKYWVLHRVNPLEGHLVATAHTLEGLPWWPGYETCPGSGQGLEQAQESQQ